MNKHYYGFKLDEIHSGFSVGVCFSIDLWLGEFYLYFNLVKWTLCIGRFAILSNEKE